MATRSGAAQAVAKTAAACLPVFKGLRPRTLSSHPHTKHHPDTPRAHELWGEVASRLAAVLNDDTFRSLEGKSKHQLWLELCDTVTRHPKVGRGGGRWVW